MKDKEITKKKLIEAVGEISKLYGFKGVRISKVSRHAGVDRKLIYRYFGNLNNLIEAYVVENDYWLLFADHLKGMLKERKVEDSQVLITEILQELFRFFLREKEMQRLILMELNDTNSIMRSIHNVRESLGEGFLNMTDQHFKDSGINFRAVSALLVGGIYYIILHTRNNGYNFANLDLKIPEEMADLPETITKIVNWAYKAAKPR